MLDFRYHITSLVAVFLALALGILLGSVIVDKGIIAEQQGALIDSVKSDVKQVQSENKVLKKDLDETKELQDKLIPLVVQERLSGKNVVFISGATVSDDLKSYLFESVGKAGAQSLCINISGGLGLDDPETKNRLSLFFPEENLSEEDLKSKIIERLAIELATPSDEVFLKELIDMGIVKMQGNGTLPANCFVFIGADLSDFNPEAVDLALIAQLNNFNLPIVGIETEKVKNSCIPLYQEAGVSTIDNVDTVPGQISLIYTLRGVAGNFGTKSSAEKLLPVVTSQ